MMSGSQKRDGKIVYNDEFAKNDIHSLAI